MAVSRRPAIVRQQPADPCWDGQGRAAPQRSGWPGLGGPFHGQVHPVAALGGEPGTFPRTGGRCCRAGRGIGWADGWHRPGPAVPLSRCRTYFTSCMPMGAMLLARGSLVVSACLPRWALCRKCQVYPCRETSAYAGSIRSDGLTFPHVRFSALARQRSKPYGHCRGRIILGGNVVSSSVTMPRVIRSVRSDQWGTYAHSDAQQSTFLLGQRSHIGPHPFRMRDVA